MFLIFNFNIFIRYFLLTLFCWEWFSNFTRLMCVPTFPCSRFKVVEGGSAVMEGSWYQNLGKNTWNQKKLPKTRGTIWNVSWVQNLGAIYKWKGILTLENTHKRCNCWFIFGSSLNMTCYHSVICRRNKVPYFGVCLIVCSFFCLLACLLACLFSSSKTPQR